MNEGRPGSNPPIPDKDSLVFGFAPSVEGDRTRQALVDLCRVLGESVGKNVAPMRVASYGALERAIVEGRAHFGWFPPVVLARLELAGRVVPVAQCVRAGGAAYQTCLFTRADADGHPVPKIEQLHDLRAVWVDRSSAAGYVFPRLLLAAHGVDPATAFRQETFVGSHAEVVRHVVEGLADVGATFASLGPDGRILRGGFTDPDGTNARPIQVLATFGPIPNDAMACSTALAPEMTESLRRAATHPKTNHALKSALRHLFGADSLAPIAESTYNELRTLVSRALKSGVVLDG